MKGTDLLSYEDVAKRLGICRRQVNRLVAKRKLKAVRVSYKVVRFRPSDVEHLLEKNSTRVL